MLISVVRNEEREEDFRWLAHVANSFGGLWALSKSQINKKKSGKIAVLRGSFLMKPQLSQYKDIQISEFIKVSSKEQALNMLLKKRVGLYYG